MKAFQDDLKPTSWKQRLSSGHFQNLSSYRDGSLIFFSMLLVIIVYVWLISHGSWFSWPGRTGDYNQLAHAFEQKSLSLELQPNPALLALSDPYDPRERTSIIYPKDFSLYKGRYYLYFGPVPALLLAAVQSAGLDNLGDQYLVFTFVTGIFVFQSLLIAKIWAQFFSGIAVWIVVMSILFGGLISPLTSTLSRARVYEAAASGGQFFFLAGFYCIVTSLQQKSGFEKNFLFFLAGLLWALAIGSRLTEILPIGFLIIMVASFTVSSLRQNKELSRVILPMELLGSPLVIGLALLGRYNWERFHSVFETGFSYQLAGPDLEKYRQVLFSPRYILPNLYNYLVMPPRINNFFPFLESIPGNGAAIFPFITLPKVYYTTPVTGLLVSTPFILFAGIVLVSLALGQTKLTHAANETDSPHGLKWLNPTLLGSFVFGFAPFVGFFWVAPHYQTDFVPSLIILGIIGFWRGHLLRIDQPDSIRKLYVAAGIILMNFSILISILLALSEHAPGF
jgi:hypothetical protein